MTNYTPINNSALGYNRTLSSLSSLSWFFNGNPLITNLSVEGTWNLCFNAYNAVQTLVPISTGTHQFDGRATLEESVDLDIQRGHNQQAEIMAEGAKNLPELELGNHDNPLTRNPDDLEVARHLVSEDGSPKKAIKTLSKCARLWVALLIIIVLSLVVTPGLVLGGVTKQLPWGIALCGLIATVISFFASLYYHLDK